MASELRKLQLHTLDAPEKRRGLRRLGADIERDCVARTACWSRVERVLLTHDQVRAYDRGEGRRPRWAGFARRYGLDAGQPVQWGVEALDPAGRIENAQVAVYLVYSAARGYAGIDRALYVPRSWTEDPQRCQGAGIPDGLAFATKPQLAARMIARAVDAGTPARWVAGDEVYGDNPHLRASLEDRRIGYVLAVSSTHPVVTNAGKFQAKALATRIPKRAWQRLSAGAGAKGERSYDWAEVDIHGPTGSFGRWCLLARRNRRTGELAFYCCFSPCLVPLSALVRVAGRRWTVEEKFQASKGLTGLDEHQVRRWTSWHRWATLAMLARAFLAVTAAAERRDRPAPDGLIPLTGNEIQHLFAALISPVHNLAHRLRWSQWRRRHQARSRDCHYQGQVASQP